MENKRRILIDCDPGHDDAVAIMLAARNPRLELLGITTVRGNQTLEKVTRNALNVCQCLGLDVPVAMGCAEAMVRQSPPVEERVHGDSGLDGPAFAPLTKELDPRHAIDFIIDTCEKSEEVADIDRKATEDWSKNSTWHGLKILGVQPGKEPDTEIVEFEATYTQKGIRDVHHETGLFKKINGEWLYSVGYVKAMTVVREGRKIGRNEPCPCGSGKKYKQCCGR